MANEDLKKKLEALEIRYPGNASRKQLESLLEEASKLPDPDPVEYAKSEPVKGATLFRVKTTNPGSKLNVRKKPDGEILDTVANDSTLEGVGNEEDGWQPVSYKGKTAYVMAKFVVANG